MPIPLHYKEAGPWVVARSSIITATKDNPWWTLFHDKTLNELEAKLTCDNNNLKIALARYEEARALADVTRSALYPTILGVGTAARQKTSGTVANSRDLPILFYNTFLLSAILKYEVDAWGRVRNAVIASDNLARASAFDLAAINLSMHAELAFDYIQLRGSDKAQRILDATVVAYQKALDLTKHRHQGGVAPEADVDQAMTQLENAKTLATDTRLKRAKLEHAIAVLVGEIPANFRLPIVHYSSKRVTIAPDLPSTLLGRRPDIRAAVARVRAANASIGVARAAFFPSFNLIALMGVQSNEVASLFSAQSLIWSLGPGAALSLIQPEVSQVIFDGFKLQAQLNRAKASYFEAVNAYRQTVLNAFLEVEDGLVEVRRLDEEHRSQTLATIAAKRALYQANQRYKGGIVTFLDVVIMENEALQSELALVTIETRRHLASVSLIKALGGGWHCGLPCAH